LETPPPCVARAGLPARAVARPGPPPCRDAAVAEKREGSPATCAAVTARSRRREPGGCGWRLGSAWGCARAWPPLRKCCWTRLGGVAPGCPAELGGSPETSRACC